MTDPLVDFSVFLRMAYFDPLPKRILAVLFFSVVLWVAFQIPLIKDFGKKFNLKCSQILIAILFSALFFRIVWCVLAPTSFPVDTHPSSESFLINLHGWQISKYGIPLGADGTLATRRPVGYLYLLGGVHSIFGYHQNTFKFVQIIFGTLLVWLSFLLGKTIFKNDQIGLLAAFITAIYPENIISVTIPLDEYPFFVFWFSALVLISKNLNSRQVEHTLSISLLLALSTVCRTTTLYMPFILFFAYQVCGLPFRKSLMQLIVSFVLIYLVSAPWGWTTYKHYGRPSFFTTAGLSFYGTLNDRAAWHNGYIPRTLEDGGNKEILNETNPVKQANIATKVAVEWAMKHPKKVFQWFLMRNAALFAFDSVDETTDLNMLYASNTSSFVVHHHHKIRKMKNWAYSFCFFLGLFGILTLCLDRRYFFWYKYPAFILLIAIFFYWCAIHGFFFGFKKYRWAMDLLLIYPASFFLWWLAQTRPFKIQKISLTQM